MLGLDLYDHISVNNYYFLYHNASSLKFVGESRNFFQLYIFCYSKDCSSVRMIILETSVHYKSFQKVYNVFYHQNNSFLGIKLQ